MHYFVVVFTVLIGFKSYSEFSVQDLYRFEEQMNKDFLYLHPLLGQLSLDNKVIEKLRFFAMKEYGLSEDQDHPGSLLRL